MLGAYVCACTHVHAHMSVGEWVCRGKNMEFSISCKSYLFIKTLSGISQLITTAPRVLLLDHEVDRSSFWLHGDEIFNELLTLDLTAGVCGFGVYPQDFRRVVIRQGLDNVYAVL